MKKTELTIEEKARAAKNAYAREWRKKNRERNNEIQRKYWAKRFERMAAEKIK